MTNFEKVGIFMKTFGQEVKSKAELSNDKINELRISLINEELEELKKAIKENDILIPSVIKPINNGSSVGVYIILSESDKTSFLNDLKNWKYGKYIMVEKYIKGRELTCGIIDNKPTEVMEIKAKNIFYQFGSWF